MLEPDLQNIENTQKGITRKIFFVLGLIAVLSGIVFISVLVVKSNKKQIPTELVLINDGKSFSFPEPERQFEENIYQDIDSINQSIIFLSASYKKATGEDKKDIFTTLKKQTELRKKRMLDLVQDDPAKFFSSVMPLEIVNALPTELRSNFEKEAVVSGRLEAIMIDDFVNKIQGANYSIINEKNEEINFFPVGEVEGLISGKEVRVHGYQLENNLVAPIFNNTFEILPVGNTPSSFNSGSRFGVQVAKAETLETIGEQKIAVILLKDPRDNDNEFFGTATKDDIKYVLNEGRVQSFYKEASYDKMWLNADVFGWYISPSEFQTGSQFDKQKALTTAVSVADPDIDFSQYKRIILILSHVGGRLSVGNGTVGRTRRISSQEGNYLVSVSWVTWSPTFAGVKTISGFNWNYDKILHEFGHNLGVVHADRWLCSDPPTDPFYGATCKHEEYGNRFDVMGFRTSSLHFNAGFKDKVGWFDTDSIVNVTESGSYTYILSPLESNSGVRAVKIIPPKGKDGKTFYLETRRAIGFDASLGKSIATEGVFINQFRPSGGTYGGPDTILINMGTRINISRANLVKGDESYYFSTYGIKVGPIVSDDAQSTTFDVVLDDIPLPCVRGTPIITLIGSNDIINTNPGNIRYFTLGMKNTDSSSCAKTGFQITFAKPIGWTAGLTDPMVITLGPNDSAGKSIKVEVPITAVAGTYEVKVTVKNIDGNLATENRIQYSIEIPCVRGTPTATLTGADNPMKTNPGDSHNFPLSFKSADSVSCSKTDFQTTVTTPTGWTISVLPDQTNISLGPNETGSKSIQVKVPTTVVPGTYEVKVIVKNVDGNLMAENKIQYAVEIPCVRGTPVATLTGADTPVKTNPGDSRVFPFYFKDTDSSSCAKTDFQTVVTGPTGWTATVIDQTNISLSPNETGSKSIQVGVPTTAVAGTYEVKVIVKNIDGNLMAEKRIAYSVEVPIAVVATTTVTTITTVATTTIPATTKLLPAIHRTLVMILQFAFPRAGIGITVDVGVHRSQQ